MPEDDVWMRDHLRRELGAPTAEPVPGGDWHDVVVRADRRHRRRTTTTFVAVIAVVASVIGIARLGGRAPDEVTVAAPATAGTTAPPPTYPSPDHPVGVRIDGYIVRGADGTVRLCPARPTGDPIERCPAATLEGVPIEELGPPTSREGALWSSGYVAASGTFDGRRLLIGQTEPALDGDLRPGPYVIAVPPAVGPAVAPDEDACRTLTATYEAALPGQIFYCQADGDQVRVTAMYVDERITASWRASLPGTPIQVWSYLQAVG